MNLIEMEPSSDLTSTGYALSNRDNEYLILQPNATSEPFTAILEAGTYSVEWFDVERRETHKAENVTVRSQGDIRFTIPFDGPAVLYLKLIRRL